MNFLDDMKAKASSTVSSAVEDAKAKALSPVSDDALLAALHWRYAVKKFDPTKKIPEKTFQELLDALILTPSSYGLQPWKFIVVQDPALRAQLLPHSWNQNQIVDASHLVVFAAQKAIDEAYVTHFIAETAKTRGIDPSALDAYKAMMLGDIVTGPRSASADTWAAKQCYIALGNLLTAAAAFRVDACPMEGFIPEKYDELLGLPALGLTAAVVCPLGYRAADDDYATKAKVRFSKDELVIIK